MQKPLLFAELCAGTAAVSLKLEGGKHARPPVSRMGAKTGYGQALLQIMGLRCGLGAHRYLWCDPDAGVRLLLEAYRDHDLALAAAEVIRGWKDEDPRALWERLKAEGPVKGAEPREAARLVMLSGWSVKGSNLESAYFRGPHGVSSGDHDRRALTIKGASERLTSAPTLPADIHPDASQVDPREVARWARIVTSNRLINLSPETWRNTGQGGNTFGGDEFCTDAAVLAGAFEAVPSGLPAEVLADGTIDPREVARWTWLVLRSVAFKGPQAGYMPSGEEDGSGRWVNTPDMAASKWEVTPTLPADIHPDASQVDPREVARWIYTTGQSVEKRDSDLHWFTRPNGKGQKDVCAYAHALTEQPTQPAFILPAAVYPAPTFPEGERVIAYCDPPYLNTTGYGHDLPRSEVVRLALAWQAAGADVYISEAEPIAALVAQGWHAVEITSTRIGQKRTFSKQKREWLTCSVPPAWTPGANRQRSLFGALGGEE